MSGLVSRRSARAPLCALLMTLSAVLLFPGPTSAQSTSNGTQLPPVPVLQAAPKPTQKTVTAKKAPLPARSEVVPQEAAIGIAQEASATATALGTYNPALDLEGIALPPGTTLTTAGPVQGYRALSAMSSTKTATPIEHIPQSIQVVPKEVIGDQTSISVNEAVRNVSNVQSFNDLNIGNSDLAGAKIRGLKAEQWLDGLVVNYDTGDRDSFANVERIEVLKGPSAILYGGGSGAPAGGAINVISKLPTDTAFGSVGVTFGSDSYARPYFDVNQPINADATVLFRVTGEYTSADSFIEVLEQERYSINPTLTLTNKTDTTLTIQARKSRFTQQAYPGLPVVGTITGSFDIDRHLYVGDPHIPKSYTEVEGVTVTFDHKFDDVWSFALKSRISRSSFDQKSQGTFAGTPDFGTTSTWALLPTDLYQEQEEFTVNPNVQAKFKLGETKTVVLIGADYNRSTDQGYMVSDLTEFFFGGTTDLLNPVFAPYADPDPSSPFFAQFSDFDNVYTTTGAYAQVQTTVFDRVHILAGLRWSKIDVDYTTGTILDFGTLALLPPADFSSADDEVLPRIGAVVDLVKGLSIYASYSESMRWAGFNYVNSVAPIFSSQREAGLKFQVGQALSGTVAVFDIDRTNIPVITGFAVASVTSQQSRGVDADLVYQPSRNWQLLANYGYVQAENVSGTLAGKKLVEVPEHSGRLWVNYTFDPDVLRGWSIGAGIYGASGAFVDASNVYKTSPYYTIDAKLGYESEHYAASLNVKNVTGEEFFVPYPWFGGQVAPGADRAFYGTFAYKY